MRNPVFELPHWMHWLGGSLAAEGFEDLKAVNLYGCETSLRDFDIDFCASRIRETPADVYFFSPMTPNLPLGIELGRLVKKLNSDAINVYGGVAASALAHPIMKEHPDVIDYVVVERGEKAAGERATGRRCL